MSHSNSSLNTFASCMAKYWHGYVNHTPPCKPTSPHLLFGTMAHDVLYRAGALRDDCADGVVTPQEYYTVIPSEVIGVELKETFGIESWGKYFKYVIDQVAKYEEDLCQEIQETSGGGELVIEREIKLQLTPEETRKLHPGVHQPLVGIIDLLLMCGNYAYVLDYKFSTTQKTQDDFDMNSQLPLYALFVNKLYGIPLRNIKYGYIDIPKKDFGKPTILSSGLLSRDKTQNVSAELYKKAVIAIHGEDDPKYNCEPGGYYYDIYCNLALRKAAYLSMQWLDNDVYEAVIQDLLDAAE